MGPGTAKLNGDHSDDETGLLLVEKGDPIVLVNIVATNTSDQTLYVGLDRPDLWATPVDLPYSQGLVGYDEIQGAAHGVYQDNLNVNVAGLPFALGVQPGESCARGYALPSNTATSSPSPPDSGPTRPSTP
ncbi:MAG: hypothetical protein LBJ44_11365 [Propionibacteriaceae bacterium]|jgi:hypothetical protein|nr:hypothetical protein [Propionibacteriaceae bacterium]